METFYAKAVGNSIKSTDFNDLLTPDVLHTLNTNLSKLGTTILKELYQADTPMQQKILAANVHTSPTSLSNILSKLEAITPELLNSEKIGRSKYYSLTEIAKVYVAQELLPAPGKIHPFTAPSKDGAVVEDTLAILHMFQRKAGAEWYFALDDLLSGKTNEYEHNGELMDLFSDFLNNMVDMKLQRQLDSIHEIHNQLGQKILIGRLESCLKERLAGYYALEPLFSLEKQDFETATLFIDYIFSTKIDSSLFEVPKLSDSFSVPITETEYSMISTQVANMVSDIINYEGNKIKAIEFWKQKYHTTSHSLTYIAEKCYFIYKMRRDITRSNSEDKLHFLLSNS